jgi:hypothetical protein
VSTFPIATPGTILAPRARSLITLGYITSFHVLIAFLVLWFQVVSDYLTELKWVGRGITEVIIQRQRRYL